MEPRLVYPFIETPIFIIHISYKMGFDLHHLAVLLLIIGGLNWGTVGLFGVDLVAAVAGRGSLPARAIYLAVGLSAVFVGIKFFRITEGFQAMAKETNKAAISMAAAVKAASEKK